MLLQKTYVTDPISKKVKKNNGELPKILIKNNHPPIISREIYDRAQQERARRGSKRKVSKNSVTEQSKYSSLHALSEILICGECLTPYRRAVWTKRNGEKQAVWRCISRLDHGTKYCKDSATMDEESLHAAIMEAVNATRNSRREMLPFVSAHLERTLREQAQGDIDVEQIEGRISELKAETMALVAQCTASGTVGKNEGRLKSMSDEIRDLCDMLAQYRQSSGAEDAIQSRIDAITEILENEPDAGGAYDDALVRQLIDTIKVKGEDRLEIVFKCGLTYEQSVTPKVRRLNSAS